MLLFKFQECSLSKKKMISILLLKNRKNFITKILPKIVAIIFHLNNNDFIEHTYSFLYTYKEVLVLHEVGKNPQLPAD